VRLVGFTIEMFNEIRGTATPFAQTFRNTRRWEYHSVKMTCLEANVMPLPSRQLPALRKISDTPPHQCGWWERRDS